MHSKNHKALTRRQQDHLLLVKSLACSLCDAPGPSEAHHIKQDNHYSVVALCPVCHGGPGHGNGWHGNKTLWRIRKMDEADALYITIERLVAAMLL
jgi:hypothetical protein